MMSSNPSQAGRSGDAPAPPGRIPELLPSPGRRLLVPDYNLSLDLVRTTEAAALAAARWVGRGDKNAADQAAVDAMRLFFNTVHMDGVVVMAKGRKTGRRCSTTVS
jgi:hypothetical protein